MNYINNEYTIYLQDEINLKCCFYSLITYININKARLQQYSPFTSIVLIFFLYHHLRKSSWKRRLNALEKIIWRYKAWTRSKRSNIPRRFELNCILPIMLVRLRLRVFNDLQSLFIPVLAPFPADRLVTDSPGVCSR